MESATIDTEIEDRSRVSPPSYCDHLTPCLYRAILQWVRVKRGNGKTETKKRKRKSGKKGKRRKSGKAEKRVKGGKAEKRKKG